MFITYLFLALSLSIDSIGIGITYGLKNTKISHLSKLILFVISISFTTISLLFGEMLGYILPPFFSKLIGSFILIFIGFLITIQVFKKRTDEKIDFDFDKSQIIDWKEAILLSIALSIDSISVSIGGGIIGINSIFFPLLVSTFHMSFLFLGKYIGKKINGISKFPDYIWNLISGVLLIIIGITRLFV